MTLKPEKIDTLSLNALSERVSSLKVKSLPTWSGKKRAALQPQAQNQVPNRVGIGAPVAAIASPLVSRKPSRIGSATVTAAPLSTPLRKLRLVQLAIALSP